MQGLHLRKYGVEATIDFSVYEIDGIDLRVDWIPAAADCEVMKDGGASTQCANTATDEGSTYSIVLTATEMQAARLVVKVVDAATKVFLDTTIMIETYGNASAQHAFDFDTATQKVDIDTLKTQALTVGAAVTINPSVGAATIVPTNTQFEARTVSNTAALAIEDQYDGTGLIGNEYPARQDQVVTGSSGGGGARNWAPVEDNTGGAIWDSVVFVGSVVSGTYESAGVGIIDSHSINDVGNDIDIVYGFAFSDDQIVTGIHVYADMDGKDRLDLEMYNFVTSSWVPVLTIEQRNAVLVKLTNDFQGTGANLGKAYARFDNNEPTTPENLELWTLLLETTSSPTGIPNGASITLDSAQTEKNFVGRRWSLILGSQNISNSFFSGAKSVTGTAIVVNGTGFDFDTCNIINPTLTAYGSFKRCAISGLILTSSADAVTDAVRIFDSKSGVAGAGVPTITFAAVTKTTTCEIRNWFGGGNWVFTADCTASIEVTAGGTHTVTNNGANVELRGNPKASVISSSGAGTINVIVGNGSPVTIVSGGGTVNISGIYGDIDVSGASGTVNLYGFHGPVTDAEGGATLNELGTEYDDITKILEDVTGINGDVMRGTDGANTTVPDAAGVAATPAEVATALSDYDGPTEAEMNARTIPSADYVVVTDTIARVTLVDTVTDNTDLVSAADVKTAMEADNSDLDYLVTDLINKKEITIANSNTLQYNDAGVLIGTITAGYADDTVTVSRKAMRQVKP